MASGVLEDVLYVICPHGDGKGIPPSCDKQIHIFPCRFGLGLMSCDSASRELVQVILEPEPPDFREKGIHIQIVP